MWTDPDPSLSVQARDVERVATEREADDGNGDLLVARTPRMLQLEATRIVRSNQGTLQPEVIENIPPHASCSRTL